MTEKEFRVKAQKIVEYIHETLPESESLFLSLGNWQIEFFDSTKRQQIADHLEFAAQNHRQALADESAKNN